MTHVDHSPYLEHCPWLQKDYNYTKALLEGNSDPDLPMGWAELGDYLFLKWQGRDEKHQDKTPQKKECSCGASSHDE